MTICSINILGLADWMEVSFDSREERDDRLRMILADPRLQKGVKRIEALDYTPVLERYDDFPGMKTVPFEYRQPMPSCSLSLELNCAFLMPIEAPAANLNMPCHFVRLGHLREISMSGHILVGNESRKLSRVSLLDRTLVLDKMWAFRQSRIGSQSKFDQRVTKRNSGLIALSISMLEKLGLPDLAA